MSKFILKHFFLKSHFRNTLILILWLVDKCYDFYGSFGSISLMTYSNTIILLISNRFLRLQHGALSTPKYVCLTLSECLLLIH